MTTRTIVTSQPDVACDVCARRLLRGEQPDVFLAAGRRLTVCELCAPRAVHEGWMRETEQQSLTLPPMRPRRGRSFFDRLRQVARPAGESDGRRPSREPAPPEPAHDFFDARADDNDADPGAEFERVASAEPVPAHAPPAAAVSSQAAAPAPDPQERYVLDALAVFNASEFPRRVAGVARSLGPAVVSARSAEHLASVVRIVVAWELCWYRYEVDLSEEVPVAVVIAQGTELDELTREERTGNAIAHDNGALSPAP